MVFKVLKIEAYLRQTFIIITYMKLNKFSELCFACHNFIHQIVYHLLNTRKKKSGKIYLHKESCMQY